MKKWTKKFDEKVEEFGNSVSRGDKASKISTSLLILEVLEEGSLDICILDF